MILQSDLAAVLAARELAAKQLRTRAAKDYAAARAQIERELAEHEEAYKQSPAYRRYVDTALSLRQRLDEVPLPAAVVAADTANKEAAQLLESLKKRYRQERDVEPGPLRLAVEATPSVSWEAVLTKLREVPAVAKALLGTAAAAVLKQAHAKDPAASFVTERITRFDVVSAE